MHGPFDIIFCRNVLIYFKSDVSHKILERFNKLLAINATLFLGHSETLHETRDDYQPLGMNMYKKIR